MSTSQKRVCLPLKKKIEVIQEAKRRPKVSVRELAEQFVCGKTQIARILKNKEALMSEVESNRSLNTRKRSHSSKFSNKHSWYNKHKHFQHKHSWYTLACSRNIHPGGPQLIEKARQIAEQLGVANFKGTNGWIEKWKKRYNIKQMNVCVESGDVQGETVSSWMERLPEILRGYAKEDIYNIDETGSFWRALPDRGFGEKGIAV